MSLLVKKFRSMSVLDLGVKGLTKGKLGSLAGLQHCNAGVLVQNPSRAQKQLRRKVPTYPRLRSSNFEERARQCITDFA